MISQHHGRPALLPDFLIAGAAKAGTSSIYQYLGQHPKIFFPANKEPYFFSFREYENCADPTFKKLIVLEKGKYERLFSSAPIDSLSGEASTSYLYTHDISIPKILENYRGEKREPKILLILRNPIERAFSHYSYLVRNGVEHLPFEEAIRPEVVRARKSQRYWDYDYVDYGLYYAQVKAFLGAFSQVRVFLFEDLKDPESMLAECCSFLGVHGYGFDVSFHANPSGAPRNRAIVNLLVGDWPGRRLIKAVVPEHYRRRLARTRDRLLKSQLQRMELRAETREQLNAYYRDDIMRLQGLIGRNLSHWLQG